MSGLAYLIDALGGFAGGLSNALNQQQGQSDLGNALSALYGGSGGSGGSSGGPMSGGQSSPAPQAPVIPLNPTPQFSGSGEGQGGQYQGRTNLSSPGITLPPQQPQQAPMGGPGPLAAQVQAATAQPATASPGGGIGSDAAASQRQQLGSPVGQTNQSNGPPNVAPQGQQQRQLGSGPLTLPALIGAIKQQNPNISGTHLAAAVERAMPLLSMEGLNQYRGIAQQLAVERQQSLEADRADRSADRKQGMSDRMQMASDRLQGQNERYQQGIELRLQALQQAKTFKEAQQSATALRTAIKDKLEATNHQIQMQYNLTDEQKAELYKQAQDDAKLATDNLDKLLAQKNDKGGTEGGKETSKDNKAAPESSKETPKISDEQKSTYKKQAQDAIAKGKDAAWVKSKYKELTGEDLGD